MQRGPDTYVTRRLDAPEVNMSVFFRAITYAVLFIGLCSSMYRRASCPGLGLSIPRQLKFSKSSVWSLGLLAGRLRYGAYLRLRLLEEVLQHLSTRLAAW